MSNAGQHDPFRRPVAASFSVMITRGRRCNQQLAEEPDGSKSTPSWLDQNIEHKTVPIDQEANVTIPDPFICRIDQHTGPVEGKVNRLKTLERQMYCKRPLQTVMKMSAQ